MAEQRSVRYSIDLLSPVDIQLLRRAVVISDPDTESAIVEWEFCELPHAPR